MFCSVQYNAILFSFGNKGIYRFVSQTVQAMKFPNSKHESLKLVFVSFLHLLRLILSIVSCTTVTGFSNQLLVTNLSHKSHQHDHKPNFVKYQWCAHVSALFHLFFKWSDLETVPSRKATKQCSAVPKRCICLIGFKQFSRTLLIDEGRLSSI